MLNHGCLMHQRVDRSSCCLEGGRGQSDPRQRLTPLLSARTHFLLLQHGPKLICELKSPEALQCQWHPSAFSVPVASNARVSPEEESSDRSTSCGTDSELQTPAMPGGCVHLSTSPHRLYLIHRTAITLQALRAKPRCSNRM